ncbi:hypothetical protein [Pseudoflavonifractor sp. AF19-9AC]|uniref:hypothetical protein n=1 Tax=Pseudoflavonifractor sp. AF19-9AC TaxID=2292244 RepID=UPI0011C434FA|nr:hypothetical protein [Pseudoflavonifractor sp. AF19-9AC]
MDKGKKRRRAIELAKDVLIVLLTCSALWLVTRSQIMGSLSGLLQEEETVGGSYENLGDTRADARPLRIVASLPGETRTGRCGLQYDQTAVDGVFQQVAGLLVETMSSAGEPEKVTRSQWEKALTTPPSICFDFQGEIPLSVLSGWLAGEEMDVEATVRRLVLTTWESGVALYYQDRAEGSYYRCLSEVANSQHLIEVLATLQDNGALYAFESELYDWLDPDTLLTEPVPTPSVYQAKNPLSGVQNALEQIMAVLELPISSSSFYSVGDERVARIGGDNLRLSGSGVLEYHAEEGSALFPVSAQGGEASLFEIVERCRQLAAATVGANAGQARLYFSGVRETDTGLEVAFDYCLNGIPVHLEEGDAAWFQVEDGRITQFVLRYRSYTESGETSVVLPIRQAAAAMEALNLKGEELLLIYSDVGGETVSASWAAVESGT